MTHKQTTRSFPVPEKEEERLHNLNRCDILDTPTEESFDRIADLTKQLLDVPVALISLVDRDREWHKSASGTERGENPRSDSFCAYAITKEELLMIPDARKDDRFKNNPYVTGEKKIELKGRGEKINIISYTGATITSEEGHTLGTLCVIDNKPRNFTKLQLRSIRTLAQEISSKIDRRWTDQKLAASERRFRQMAENIGGVFYNFEPDFSEVHYISMQFEEIWEREIERVYDFPELFTGAIHEDDREEVLQTKKSMTESDLRQNPDLKYRIRTPDGEIKWIKDEMFGIWNQGNLERIGGYAKDISKRTKARQELEETAHQLELAREAASLGIWKWNSKTNEIQYDNKLLEILGLEEEPQSFDDFIKLVHPDDRKRIRKQLKRVIKNQQRHHSKKYRVLVDHEIRWLQDHAIIQADETGDLSKFVGSVIDVTEQKQLEQKLRDRKKALERAKKDTEQANRAKSDFLANMSHDIRTPLNAIMGMLERLEQSSLGTHQREYVHTASNASQTLLNLMNDILDLSKVESGELTLKETEFELEPLFMDVISYFSRKAHQKQLEFPVFLDLNCPGTLIGDQDKIQQILINLISNAIQFTDTGEVRVRIFPDPDSEEPGAIRFEIEDTGMGITEQEQKEVFQRFNRSSSSITSEIEGTGLGLTICKELVRRMGGRIGVDSEPETGSTFWFTVPFPLPNNEVKSEFTRIQRMTEESGVSLSDMNVVIASNSDHHRSYISRMLKPFGPSMTEVSGGYETIEVINRMKRNNTPVDLLLLDKQFSDLDGFKVTKELQDLMDLQHILMMVPAKDLSAHQAKVNKQGIGDYLVKPVAPSVLIKSMIRTRGGKLGSDNVRKRVENDKMDWSQMEAPPRILIAEDNEHNRKLMEAILKDYPVLFDFAQNGTEALRMSKSGLFDLIFMDVRMPEMDGLEATRQFRAWEAKNGMDATPVIALTAQALEENRQESLQAGCDEHITKPVREEKLMSSIHHFLAPKSSNHKASQNGSPPLPEKQTGQNGTVPSAHTEKSNGNAKIEIQLDERFQSLVPDFLEDLYTTTKLIKEKAEQEQYQDVQNLAHDIKGSSGSFGVEQVETMARTIEEATEHENAEAIRTEADNILNYLDQLSVQFD